MLSYSHPNLYYPTYVFQGLRDGVINNVDSIGRLAEKIPAKKYRNLGTSALGNFTIGSNLKNNIKVAKSQVFYDGGNTYYNDILQELNKYEILLMTKG